MRDPYAYAFGGTFGLRMHTLNNTVQLNSSQSSVGIVLSFGAAAVAYISCEAAQRLKLADSAKLFALTFLLVTFGAQDGASKQLSLPTLRCLSWLIVMHACRALHNLHSLDCKWCLHAKVHTEITCSNDAV